MPNLLRVFVMATFLSLSPLAVQAGTENLPGPITSNGTGETSRGSEKWLWIVLAFPCSAVSALFQWREQWLPQTHEMPADTFPLIHASWSAFIGQPSFTTLGRLMHNLNNLTTELVRADEEFWAKLLLFVIAVQFFAILWLRSRCRRWKHAQQ